MIDQVVTFIKKKELIASSDKVLVAVSGGVDSMVLIHILKELGYDISVAHMNFQLRGSDSDQDESFVREWCASRDISFSSKKVDTNAEMNAVGSSTQMAARKLRYKWFEELCNEHDFQKIATAHHLNDSLETVLLNFVKGTGIKGLVGIAPKNEKVIRPLLNTSKEEIIEYAKKEDLEWRKDSSNKDSKYQRNLIRNEIVPLLQKINPSLIDTFRSTNERTVGANDVVRKVVDQIRKEHWDETEKRLNLSWFKGSSDHLLLLSELLRPFGASYSLAVEIGEEHSSGKTFLTKTHTIFYDRGQLIFTKNGNSEVEPLEISKPQGSYKWGDWEIKVEVVNSKEVQFGDEQVAYFDASKIKFPVKVRSWKEGDWFTPLGMTGKKKVSDFMIDSKVPASSKNQIPIFESDREIIWVGGYRVDNRYRVTKDSLEILKIELT